MSELCAAQPEPMEIVTQGTREAKSMSAGIGITSLLILGVQGASFPLTILTSIITSRFLQPNGRGAFVLTILSVTIATNLLSNAAAVTHEIGLAKQPTRVTVLQALSLDVVLGLAGAGLLTAIDLLFGHGRSDYVALGALSVPFALIAATLSGAVLALGQIRSYNVLQVLMPALSVGGLCVFVIGLSMKVTGAVLAWTCAQALLAATALWLTRQIWRPLELRSLFSGRTGAICVLSLRLAVSNVVTLVHYRIELFLLQVYLGLQAVGIYSLATSLAEVTWFVSASIASSVVAPAVKSDDRGAAVIVAKGGRHAMIATAAAGLVVATAGIVAIPTVYGHAFDKAKECLPILIVAAVSIAPAASYSVYLSMKTGRSRYSLVNAALSAFLTGGAAVLLIPGLGVVGAAISTTIGYAVSQLVESLWFARLTGIRCRQLLPRRSDFVAYRDLAGVIFARIQPLVSRDA